MAELLEKIPVEECWAITAKILTAIMILRGMKYILPLLGKGEGIISPIWGAEKYDEINEKIWAEGGSSSFPWVKETFNIPVEDAIGAAKLSIVAGILANGPEVEYKIVEETKERVIVRWNKCPFWDRQKELGVDPEHMACHVGHDTFNKEGLKAIDSRLIFELKKAFSWGDPYCEEVYEFKEE